MASGSINADTWVIGGLGGPGAMNATVLAVALLATTGSLTFSSTLEMLRRLRTVQMPWEKFQQPNVMLDHFDKFWYMAIFILEQLKY